MGQSERLRGSQMPSYPSDLAFSLQHRAQVLINPWAGLDGQDAGKLLRLIQQWISATAGPHPETYKHFASILPSATPEPEQPAKPEPVSDNEKTKEPGLETVIRRFLGRSV